MKKLNALMPSKGTLTVGGTNVTLESPQLKSKVVWKNIVTKRNFKIAWRLSIQKKNTQSVGGYNFKIKVEAVIVIFEVEGEEIIFSKTQLAQALNLPMN